MKKFKTLASVAAMASMASGCVQISTSPDLLRTASPSDAMPGVAYNLPMLQYQIEVTRTLTSCPSVDKVGDIGVDAAAGLSFAIGVKATQRYVRGESYVVDYTSLSNAFKTTGFTLTPYKTTGNLNTINVKAEDQSGEFIKDVVKIGIVATSLIGGPATFAPASLGAMAIGNLGQINALTAKSNKFSLSFAEKSQLKELNQAQKDYNALMAALASVPHGPKPIIDCAPAVRTNLKAQSDATDELAAATTALETATKKLANYTLLVGVHGFKKETREANAAALATALDEQDAASAAIAAAKKKLSDATAALSTTTHYTWPNRLPERDGVSMVSQRDLSKFAGLLLVRNVDLYDGEKFAAALASFRNNNADAYDRLIVLYPALNGYLSANGGASPITPPQFKYCAPGNADIAGCLVESLSVATNLGPVEVNEGTCSDGIEADRFPVLGCRTALPRAGYTEDATHYVNAREFDANHYPVAKGGIFVRQPIEGRLKVCRAKIVDATGATQPAWSFTNNKLVGGKIAECAATDKNLLIVDAAAAPTIAPQLGQLRYLPFRNKMFESNKLKLELAEDGSIITFEYERPKSSAATAAAAGADAAKQILDIDEKRRKDKATAYTDAKAKVLADLTYDVDRLAKEKALLAAQAGDPVDPNATKKAVESATAMLDAESALAVAQIKRADALAAVAAYQLANPGRIQ